MLQIKDVKDTIAQFLQKIQSEKQSLASFGCFIQNNSIHVANPSFDEQTQISSFELYSVTMVNNTELAIKLRALREQWQLTNREGCLVLGKDSYQTLLIDLPDVKPREYRAAAIWQAKDLLKYPLEDCAIDIFFPSKIIPTHANKLYVVAAKKSYLIQITEAFENVQIPITSIITEEFALKNILVALIDNNYAAILVKHDATYLFLVVGNGDILFTRSITSNVVAELYRSFEFYTITLKQARISELYLIYVEEAIQAGIAEYFTNNDYVIRLKTFDEIFSKYKLDQQQLNLPNLLAMGGAFNCQY